MLARSRPLRIEGEVPDNYSGPVYYRTCERDDAPFDSPRRLKFAESEDRIGRLHHPRNRGRNILRSGLILDADGALLPEFQAPLKARLTSAKPEGAEFLIGDPAIRVSERVHDAIVALEPDAHVILPIDAAHPAGHLVRQYLFYIGRNTIWGEPVLDPSRNALEPVTYVDGSQGYRAPPWMIDSSQGRSTFGYLSAPNIFGLHLFKGGDDTNGALFFSPDLVARLRPLGDIFARHITLVPIGVAG